LIVILAPLVLIGNDLPLEPHAVEEDIDPLLRPVMGDLQLANVKGPALLSRTCAPQRVIHGDAIGSQIAADLDDPLIDDASKQVLSQEILEVTTMDRASLDRPRLVCIEEELGQVEFSLCFEAAPKVFPLEDIGHQPADVVALLDLFEWKEPRA
jgi:hypothetical protein